MEARALVREARSQYFPPSASVPLHTVAKLIYDRIRYELKQRNWNWDWNWKYCLIRRKAVADICPSGQYFLEPDLWDKVRNTVRANQYNAQLSAADLENERLSEQASLAEYFFEIRGQDALQQILDATVDADKKSVDSEQAATTPESTIGFRWSKRKPRWTVRGPPQSILESRAPSMNMPSPCS